MFVVTGGAGFIGSNIVAALDEKQAGAVVVCDRLGDGDKWRNIAKRELADIVVPEHLMAFLDDNHDAIEAIFHMGAVSSTTEADADLIIAANFKLSLDIWSWCAAHDVRLVYASSAATYGRWRPGLRRRRPARRPGAAAAAQPLWLEQAPVRPTGRAPGRRGRHAAAAVGRTEVL